MKKSIQIAFMAATIFTLTACSGGAKPTQTNEIVSTEVSDADGGGIDSSAVSGDTDAMQKEMSERKEEAQTGDAFLITSRSQSADQVRIAPSDTQAVKLSIKDGGLYLDQEVLSVQDGVGSDSERNRTPEYLIKVKPGQIFGYSQRYADSASAGSFAYSYINEDKTIEATLSLSNHFVKAEDFTKSVLGGENVTASDGTILKIESTYNNEVIDKAKIFDPVLGGINVRLLYNLESEEGHCKTGDDVMNLISPYLADFRENFEVVSEKNSSDTTPMVYVQLDSDYFSYNIDNAEKLFLEFNVRHDLLLAENSINLTFENGSDDLKLKINANDDGLNGSTEIGDNRINNKDLLEKYGKGLLVPVTSEEGSKYGYDQDKLLLLTDKAVIKGYTHNDDDGGFTKEDIEDGLSFVFDKGAMALK